MPRKKNAHRRLEVRARRSPFDYEPPGWLSTEELEEELSAAVVTGSRLPRPNARLERIHAYFARDEPEDELQYHPW